MSNTINRKRRIITKNVTQNIYFIIMDQSLTYEEEFRIVVSDQVL